MERRASPWKVIRIGLPVLLVIGLGCAAQYWLKGQLESGMSSVIVGWVAALLILSAVIPATTVLSLSEEGIEFRWLWKYYKFGWHDFEPDGYGRTVRTFYGIPIFTTVGFRFMAGSLHLTPLRNLTSLTSGFHFTFPNFFPGSDEDLITLLTDCHITFGGRSTEGRSVNGYV